MEIDLDQSKSLMEKELREP